MTEFSLNGRWSLHYYDFGDGINNQVYLDSYDDSSWMSAQVPGEVHLDLINAGKIDEPLYADNALKCQWVEYKEWWYRKQFVVPEGSIKTKTELTFHGLDLTASVWLNGIKIGEHHNAFTSCTFDVTGLIREGENLLAVRLEVGLRSTEGKEINKYKLWDDDYQDWRRVWMRKPQFTFQWDWSPRLLNCGISRGVELKSYQTLLIRQTYLNSKLIDADAEVTCKVHIENLLTATVNAEISIQLVRDEIHETRTLARLAPGINVVNIVFPVPDAELWWPRNYGSQPLYKALVTVSENGNLTDKFETMFGIREVKLLQEPLEEDEGLGFTLAVNSTPIFCQGANWIPADSIIPRVSREKCKRLIESAAEANFNMFRVNGVGMYEDPYFYQLCDVHGIMIWQDFMFACAYYPDDDEEFCEQIRVEAEWVVNSLYNHASIVLWCGNNENDWLHNASMIDQGIEHPFYGEKIYHGILPEICNRLDETRPYWPSSPFGSTNPNSELSGDSHAWRVSHHGKTNEEKWNYRLYEEQISKFCSEFGYLSPPSKESLEKYLPHHAIHSGSPEWKFHNNTIEVGQIVGQLNYFYKDVKTLTFDEYLDYSMMIHAEALKCAMEHFKRRKFICSGALFWMYSDSWGCVGWTIIDYYLNRRPSYYYVKNTLKPLTVSMKEEANYLVIWITNDYRKAIQTQLLHGFEYFTSRVRALEVVDVEIAANSSKEVLRIPISHLTREQRIESFYYTELVDDKITISSNRWFFEKFKELKIVPVNLRGLIRQTGNQEYELNIDSSTFAWMVKISVPDGVYIEDNYVDVLGGKTKTLKVTGDNHLVRQLSIKALNTRVMTPVIYTL